MNREYIEFKKERALGDIITDAFKFIRLEWKPFLTTILKASAIPIILAVVGMLYYLYSFSDISSNSSANFGGMFLSLLIMMVSYLLALVFINLSGMYYIKSYIDNKGVVNNEEITKNTKEKFWSFTGFGILAMLIIIVSFMLCFFPAIYTGTVLSLGASILVFENESASSTIGKSFDFIKGYFWETLGVVFVVGLLVGVLGSVFQIPTFIYQMVKMGIGLGRNNSTAVLGLFSDPIYLLLNAISVIGKFLFYTISLITNVFLYFDINEKKNATGTIEKIESLGE